MDGAERAVRALPVRGRQASWSAKLEDRHNLARRALGYVELYGAYTETEARYRVDRLMALWETLGEDDRRTFAFDPAAIDWRHYIHDVHLPSIVRHARVRTSPGRSRVDDRSTRTRRAVLSEDRHLAVFDLEHTLVASNVVDSYAWMATRHLSPSRRARLVAELLREAPSLLALDRRDRSDFLRFFYRRYEGASVAELEADAWDHFHEHLLPRTFPDGIARVREHRRLGHRTLLITGALDFVVGPMRPLFDDIVCARLGRVDGRYTGELDELPPTGEARGSMLTNYCTEHGLDPDQSVAYADSASDLAMLEAVGFPVAVNPEARLSAIARRRGWLVEDWPKAAGGRPARSPSALWIAGPRRDAPWTSSVHPATACVGWWCREGPRLRAQPAPVRGGAPHVVPGIGKGGRSGAAAPGGPRPSRPPGRCLAPGAAPAVGDLRLGPGHGGRPQLALLRGAGELPVRPRPRGRRRARGPRTCRRRVGAPERCPSGNRAGARLPGSRHRPPLRLVRRGTPRQLRAGDHRAHPPGHPDRLLRRHRRRMVDRGPVAHESQLHAVPDELADVDAVLVEPLACGLHAASAPERSAEDTVAVIGAGTVGLTVIAGLDFLARKGFTPAPKALLVGARYRHQRSLAEAMGATAALPSDRLTRAVRRESGSLVVGDPTTGGMRLSGGADVVFDCVGSEDSLAAGPRDGPPTGAGHAGGHAGPDAPRPRAAVAPGGAAGGLLCLRVGALRRRPSAPHLRPRHRIGRGAGAAPR